MNPILVSAENDLDGLRSFLKANALPADDLKLEGSSFLLYKNNLGDIVGSGGLEFYGDHSLLRSVAVAPSVRGTGLGKRIVKDLIDSASGRSKDVVLLTETAEPFFLKLGFERISRESTPAEIKSSSEFSSVCPVSAAVMVKRIQN